MINSRPQSVKSAAEAAEMILRIDDVIAASKVGGESKTPSTPSSSEY